MEGGYIDMNDEENGKGNTQEVAEYNLYKDCDDNLQTFEENFERGMELFAKCKFKESQKYFEQSKFPPSYVILGNMYHRGGYIGPIDLYLKLQYFDKAKKSASFFQNLNQTNKVLCYCFGEYYRLIEKKTDLSLSFIQISANQGYAPAQNRLGICYDYGDGVKQDLSKAVEYYQRAANQGHAVAQFNLGWCWECGKGVTKDWSEAVRYYQLSADQGCSLAQNNLGSCYENGTGVDLDFSKALSYYQLSAEQGHSLAQNNLGLCYEVGKGTEKDLKKAIHYFQLASDQCLANAQYNLGNCYENGKGTGKDIRKAIQHYQLAASQDHKVAKGRLVDLKKSSPSLSFSTGF
jgi:TPR repeat protein